MKRGTCGVCHRDDVALYMWSVSKSGRRGRYMLAAHHGHIGKDSVAAVCKGSRTPPTSVSDHEDDEKALDLVDRLLKSDDARRKLDSMTDEEVAAIAIDHLWAHVPTLSPQSDLLGCIVDRLRRAKGGALK